MKKRMVQRGRVIHTAGLVGLLLLATPSVASAEVGTRAELYVDFFPNAGIPNIFVQDPPGGEYRFGDTASQASVNRSGNDYSGRAAHVDVRSARAHRPVRAS